MKPFALVLAALTGLAASASPAHACDWATPNDVFHMAESAARISVVRATSPKAATVERDLRGAGSAAVTVGSDNCNPRFEPGARYLLFLSAAGAVISDSSAARLDADDRLLPVVEAFLAAPKGPKREALVEGALRGEIKRQAWSGICERPWTTRLLFDARSWRGPAGLAPETRSALEQFPVRFTPCPVQKVPARP